MIKKIYAKIPAGLISYICYTLVFTTLKFFLSICFNAPIKILIVARYCKNGIPAGLNKSEIIVAFIMLAIRYSLSFFTLLNLKKLLKNRFGSYIVELLICFGLIEALGLLTYFYDIHFGTVMFKYFATTLYIYTVSAYFFNFSMILVVNVLLLVSTGLVIRFRCGGISLLKLLAYSVCSIMSFVLFHILFKAYIQ